MGHDDGTSGEDMTEHADSSGQRPLADAAALDAVRIVEAIGLPVVATLADGTVVSWNAAAEALYGHAAADAVGRSIVDLLVPLALEQTAAEIMTSVTGGAGWGGDFVITRADGEPLRVHVVDSPVLGPDGDVVGVVGVGREITDDLLVAQALSDSRDALRLALAAGRLGTWRWDMATGETVWDEQLAAHFGLAPGEFDGTFDTYVSLLHPEDRDEVRRVVEEAVATKSDYDVEHRVLWRDGTVRWLQGRGSVTFDAAGNVTGTTGCTADVSEDVLRRAHAAELTSSLQAGLLPTLPSADDLTIVSRYLPGEERLLLGGDFLDVTVTPAGHLAFCLGDVAGHGAVPAAIGASLRAGWRALAVTSDDPGLWLAGCAALLAAGDPPAELFVTMLTGFVSADRSRAVLLSAGHPAPVLIDGDGARSLTIEASAPLGLLATDAVVAQLALDLPDEWSLLFFTDGLFEGHARPGASERLGVTAIEQWCDEHRQPQLDALIGHVQDANGAAMDDDIAVLLLARHNT